MYSTLLYSFETNTNDNLLHLPPAPFLLHFYSMNAAIPKMNPNKVDKAIQSIYTVWLSVMAVLCIQFARTIQMAKSISEFVAQPVQRYVKYRFLT